MQPKMSTDDRGAERTSQAVPTPTVTRRSVRSTAVRTTGRAAVSSSARYVTAGAVAGLAWSCSLRMWMTLLVTDSKVTWDTVTFVLVPGTVVGGVVGLAEAQRARGLSGSRWMKAAPMGLAAVLLVPSNLVRLVTTGLGGGALGVSLVGMAGAAALAGRTPARARLALGGLAGIGVVGSAVAPAAMNPQMGLSQPSDVLAALLGPSLMGVLILASAIPYRVRQRGERID